MSQILIIFYTSSGPSIFQEADKTDAVMKWILQTKSHSVKENSDNDLQFFLDMDMAVLGRPSEGKKMKCLSILFFSFRAKANQLMLISMITQSKGTNGWNAFKLLSLSLLSETSLFPDYKKYADQIREEYIHIPDPEYKKRRSAVRTFEMC